MNIHKLEPRPMRTFLHRVATAAILCLIPLAGSADTKPFAYTYPTRTIAQGDLELEHYLDAGLQQRDNPDSISTQKKDWSAVDWKHQLEFEYGVTDATDIGFYNVFVQKPYEDLKYDGIKLRTRTNFAQGKDWLIQPGLYLEVGYTGDSVKFEEMLILSLDKRIFTTSLNLAVEQVIEFGDVETETELEFIYNYAAGVRLGSRSALSLEYSGKAVFEEGEFEYSIQYLGPTFHFAAGPFYWNISVQPQLGDNEDKAAIRARSLFAVLF